jgi:hypothetical protein
MYILEALPLFNPPFDVLELAEKLFMGKIWRIMELLKNNSTAGSFNLRVTG